MRRRALVLLAAAVAAVAGGCRADVAVDLEVAGDGSGEYVVTVSLDEEAAADVPDLADELVVDDLREAGWQLAVEPGDDGGAVVRAVRRFASLDEAGEVATQLTGADGAVSLALDRSSTAEVTTYALDGAIDLTGGLAAFSDPALREVVGGDGTGLDPDEAEVTVRLEAELPGQATSEAGPWEAALGESVQVAVRSEVRHAERRAWAAAAGAGVLLSVLSVAGRAAWARWRTVTS